MKQKKLVIACQTSGYLIRDIINVHVYSGFDVTILASKDSILTIQNDLAKGVKYKYVKSYNRSSSLKRLITWAISTIQMFFIIAFSYRKTKVLFVSNPPFGPLLPLILKNNFSLLIWDIYPDVLVSQHVFEESNLIVRWWRMINKKVYKRAEYVYTLSEGMKSSLSAYTDDEIIKVIPLWPDHSNLRRVEKGDNLFIKNNKLDGKFIVMYSGNFGDTHRMDVLVDVAKQISDDDIVIVLIGEGGKKKMIERRVEEERVKNVLLLPYQPYDFLSHSLSAADIAVITLDTQSSSMSVPSKTLNMMSLGVPLMCIASPDSELGNIVRKYSLGDIFEPDNINGMAEFVLRLKKNELERKKYADNSLKASLDFSPENAKGFVD